MKKLVLIASAAAVLCARADWEQKWVTPEIEALYDSETETLVVKGRGEVPWMPKGCFPHINDAKNLIVTEGITSIGDYVFSSPRGQLSNVVIEAGVVSLGNGVFEEQRNLRRIYMPDGLERIGINAFQYCDNLKELTIPESFVGNLSDFVRWSSIKYLTFLGKEMPLLASPDRIECTYRIQPGANLSSFMMDPASQVEYVAELKVSVKDGGVVIEPNTVKPYAGDLVLPEQWEVGGTVYTVTGIASGAFKNCESLMSIRLPVSVKSIGAEAFSGCAALKSIRFLGDKPSIAADSFAGVSAAVYRTRSGKGWDATSKTWGGAEGLYYHEFGPSEWVMEVAGDDGDRYARVMPNTTKEMTGDLKIPSTWEIDGVTYPVREVAANAFSGCTGISSVEVPSCIRRIDDGAFAGCSGLKRIHFCGDKPTIGANGVFAGVSATVYYPPSAEGWEDNSETWGGANILSYDPLDGCARGLDELLYMLNDESLNEIPITLEEGGSFENPELVVEVPEGKILIVDLNDQIIRIKSWVINGQMYLDNYSGTGWLFGNVDVGPKGKFYFQAEQLVTSIAELRQVERLNKAGADLYVTCICDVGDYLSDEYHEPITIGPDSFLAINLNGHVIYSGLRVQGQLYLSDYTFGPSGWFGGMVDVEEGGQFICDFSGNVAEVYYGPELSYVAKLNSFGADIGIRLMRDVGYGDCLDGLTVPEGANLDLDMNGHELDCGIYLNGHLRLHDSVNGDSMYNYFFGWVECGESGRLDYRGIRDVYQDGPFGYGFEGVESFLAAGATMEAEMMGDVTDSFEVPVGSELIIDLCGNVLEGEVRVNGKLTIKNSNDNGRAFVAANIKLGEGGVLVNNVPRIASDAGILQKGLNAKTGLSDPIVLGANMTCDELVIPEGAVQTIDLNGFSLTCKTLKVLGALTLIDSKGSDGFVKADRTLLGRKGSMKIDYGPVRTTYTYLNPGLMLLVK